MFTIICLLGAIATVIVRANTEIMIADWITWLLFGIAAVSVIFPLVNYFTVKKKINKQFGSFKF